MPILDLAAESLCGTEGKRNHRVMGILGAATQWESSQKKGRKTGTQEEDLHSAHAKQPV